ncbi:MAG TPA: class I fructose-bisphosphate aldolase [Acidimicrobiales bacterium]|nr:class I fructose-bisphosphate aldolase [Acidimicrobiales bacterium]
MADDLTTNAQALVAPGRGVLAADESTATIGKRFASVGVESTEENRRAYRDTLFTTPGLADSISGVIMYDETIRQSTSDGTPFPESLKGLGIQAGIKVDTGAKDLAKASGEKITEGLDGLRERIAEYVELGATFAKWRAVITIAEGGLPSHYCIEANAHALARYAVLCQEGGLVPIVEPEVLMDGDHSIERCFEVTELTQHLVFDALAAQRVSFEEMVLKPNMVISGKGNDRQAGVEEVAEQTLQCLRRTVPAAVPGIAFLSGGQSADVATEHLNAMNTMGPHPWVLTFSYGRALQDAALEAWKGEASNRDASQQALSEAARANSEATSGSYRSAA